MGQLLYSPGEIHQHERLNVFTNEFHFRYVFSWNISDYEEINENSLRLFCVLEPKIDILIIGTGDQRNTPKLSMNLLQFMKKHGINCEVLPTEQACTTFNFLSSEGRMVAGALIPPFFLSVSDDELSSHQMHRRGLEIAD